MMSRSTADQRRFADNPGLSPKRRQRARPHRSDDEIAKATGRIVRALGDRLADADPSDASLLMVVERELMGAWARAVAGWRASGFSDSDIGEALDVTKQAVQKRWPR